MKLAFWTIATGNHYNRLAQVLHRSYKESKTAEVDWLIFSDQGPREFDRLFPIRNMDPDNWWFKLSCAEQLYGLPYDLFIYLDTDVIFTGPLDLDRIVKMSEACPAFSLLENDLSEHLDWQWYLPNSLFVHVAHVNGLATMYNTSGGFWVARRAFLEPFILHARVLRSYVKQAGLDCPDEPGLAYATLKVNQGHQDLAPIMAANNRDLFATTFEKLEGRPAVPVKLTSYFTKDQAEVTGLPTLLHAPGSKDGLLKACPTPAS